MKKLSLILSLVLISFGAFAQGGALNPVEWKFTGKKISDGVYEIHMSATIQDNWHLFSQTQPDNAVSIPTSFKFNASPLIQLEGKIKEVGKMEKFYDKKLDVGANQYAGIVSFVQTVKVKGNAKTNISGSVTYQTCDDERCLPPKTVKFSVAL